MGLFIIHSIQTTVKPKPNGNILPHFLHFGS